MLNSLMGDKKDPKGLGPVRYNGIVYSRIGKYGDIPRVNDTKHYEQAEAEKVFKSIIVERNKMVQLLNSAYKRNLTLQTVRADKRESWDEVKGQGQAHIKTEFNGYVEERDNRMTDLGQLVQKNPALQNAIKRQGAAVAEDQPESGDPLDAEAGAGGEGAEAQHAAAAAVAKTIV
jgi:hypothetical protein